MQTSIYMLCTCTEKKKMNKEKLGQDSNTTAKTSSVKSDRNERNKVSGTIRTERSWRSWWGPGGLQRKASEVMGGPGVKLQFTLFSSKVNVIYFWLCSVKGERGRRRSFLPFSPPSVWSSSLTGSSWQPRAGGAAVCPWKQEEAETNTRIFPIIVSKNK